VLGRWWARTTGADSRSIDAGHPQDRLRVYAGWVWNRPKKGFRLTLLVIACAAPRVWLAAAQTPAFSQTVIQVGRSPGPIAIAKLTRSGHADIVVGNADDGTVSVLLGDGAGHFTEAHGSPFRCGANPNDIAVADMNGDGIPDLVIANTQTPYLTVLLGDGRGGFAPAAHSPFATGSNPHPHGVTVGDFYGTGKPAVVTDSWGNDRILLIPSDGRGNLLLPGTFFPADLHTDSGVKAARFSDDGNLDIVTASQRAGAVGLLLGNGKGEFRRAPGSPFAAGEQAWKFAVGDVNGDGKPDVAVIPYERDLRDSSQLTVRVLLGDGHGALRPRQGAPLSLAGCVGPDSVAIGDVTGAGIADIAVSCAQNDRLMLFIGLPDGSFRREVYPLATGWGGVAIGNLTAGRGNAIVVANAKNGTVTIMQGRYGLREDP
jgi:hypothetical protein